MEEQTNEPKRPKRPKRMAWFALDVLAFKEDPRMQALTAKDKSFWLAMIVNSFHNEGRMLAIPEAVADVTGATKKEAADLIGKLYSVGLLVTAKSGTRVFDSESPRMVLEYKVAAARYGQLSEAGKKSGEKRSGGTVILFPKK